MIDGSARAVATRPEWLPHSFNEDGSLMAAVHVTRDQRDRLTFLDDRYFRNRFPVVIHRRSEIEALAAGEREGTLRLIFHTAFCGSTLLAKAMDRRGLVTALQEPIILNDLALRPIDRDPGLHRQLLGLTLRLLARPFGDDQAVVVKAANVANRILVPTLDAAPQSRAVLLYSSLTDFLLSVAKRGTEGRVWARQLFEGLAGWTDLDLARDPDILTVRTDLEIAALAWFLQVRHFDRVAQAQGTERARLVDAADFYARPVATLTEAADFFGLGLATAAIEEIVNGPVFASHSKTLGARYSNADRTRDMAAVAAAHGGEVEAAAEWLRSFAGADWPTFCDGQGHE